MFIAISASEKSDFLQELNGMDKWEDDVCTHYDEGATEKMTKEALKFLFIFYLLLSSSK